MSGEKRNRWGLPLVVAAAAVAAVGIGLSVRHAKAASSAVGLYKANGRLEAAEIAIGSKYAGRVSDVLAKEGDPVAAGQVVARMDARDLDAQLAEAKAKVADALSGKATALSSVVKAQSSLKAAEAQLEQQRVSLESARKTNERTKSLFAAGVSTRQELENDQASYETAKSRLDAAAAQAEEARAGLEVAETMVPQAEAQIEAAKATVERVGVERDDASLKAPRDGRIQHQLARPGEVVGAGGGVLEMIDTGDVYMTIFLPTQATGRIAIGDEARIVLDSLPGYPIPATISYVASEAQFTPKAVETADEREQLVFEVRLSVKASGLGKYAAYAKVGLPGLGYVRTNPQEAWPKNLEVKALAGSWK